MPQVATDLVEILVCPETKQPVRLATAPELASVNEKIRAGTLRNRGGEAVKSELAEALVREDGRSNGRRSGCGELSRGGFGRPGAAQWMWRSFPRWLRPGAAVSDGRTADNRSACRFPGR